MFRILLNVPRGDVPSNSRLPRVIDYKCTFREENDQKWEVMNGDVNDS